MLEYASGLLNKHQLIKTSPFLSEKSSMKQICTNTTITQHLPYQVSNQDLFKKQINYKNVIESQVAKRQETNNKGQHSFARQDEIFSEQYIKRLKSQINARINPDSTVIQALKSAMTQNQRLKNQNQFLRQKIIKLHQDNSMLIQMIDHFKAEAQLQSKLSKDKLDNAYTKQSQDLSTIGNLNQQLNRLNAHIKALQTFLAKKYDHNITFMSIKQANKEQNNEQKQQKIDYCVMESPQFIQKSIEQHQSGQIKYKNSRQRHQRPSSYKQELNQNQLQSYLNQQLEYF